jgi:hypothetical protein
MWGRKIREDHFPPLQEGKEAGPGKREKENTVHRSVTQANKSEIHG